MPTDFFHFIFYNFLTLIFLLLFNSVIIFSMSLVEYFQLLNELHEKNCLALFKVPRAFWQFMLSKTEIKVFKSSETSKGDSSMDPFFCQHIAEKDKDAKFYNGTVCSV